MLKLNTSRSYPYPVTVHFFDEQGKPQQGTFKAQFKVVAADRLRDEENADKRLLDLVLSGVEELELNDADGQRLTGEALLEAVKNDPCLSLATVNAYNESIVKKNRART
jgi:hypothetical protein